jgi:biphenyl 2,3-dioxygenase beta subunit
MDGGRGLAGTEAAAFGPDRDVVVLMGGSGSTDAGEEGARASLNVQIQLHYLVEQFYFTEAALLDERRYEEWLQLFTDDAHYWMPLRRTRMSNELEGEFSAPGAIALFDDTKEMLAIRVRKLRSAYSWSENPPSRTRHLITNIRVLEERQGAFHVASNFHLYRVRLDSDEDSWIGRREDVLQRHGSSFRVSDRKIYLEQTVLLSRNLSNFF